MKIDFVHSPILRVELTALLNSLLDHSIELDEFYNKQIEIINKYK